MHAQEYETLVWSLQSEAQDIPGMFRNKVLLISLMAYAVLFGLLLVLLFGLYFMLVAALGHGNTIFRIFFVSWVLVVAPIVWLTFRMVFAPLPVPLGRELTAADVPQLFKMVSDLQQRLQGAPIHHVLITNEFNAAIAQCPRFGLFGGYRNYLVLGLPLLYAVSADEMLAIIAHEYGHLSGNHGKLGGWIYRQRTAFAALHEHAMARRERNVVNRSLAAMLDWFAPYYNAYTFVLSRQNEYEADRMSREIAGAEASASALIRINLLSNWLHGIFWPKLYAQVEQRDKPLVMPYVAMRKLLAMTMDEWATTAHLNDILKIESDVYDTHPCLSERVAALDQAAKLPPPPKTCAADALLGKFAHVLEREFDEAWWGAEENKWRKHHQRFVHAQARIAELEQQDMAALNVSDAQELALLLVEFRSVKAARQVLEILLAREGERYPKPLYYYGRALLEEGNPSGLDYLEEACRLSPALGEDCARIGYQWLCETQNETVAENWLDKLGVAHG
jgi:Zn-dependent protease with chaperone function